MKFRADVSNSGIFLKLIASLAPLSKIATLRLTKETLHLICRTPGENVQVWSCVFAFYPVPVIGTRMTAGRACDDALVS